MTIIEFRAEIQEPSEGSFTARLVPFGEPAPHNGGTVEFKRGSLTASLPVPLTVDHADGVLDRVGVLTGFTETDTGAYGQFQLADTEQANDLRSLMLMGAVTDVSVGVAVTDETDGIMSGSLDHISLVAHGRFGGSPNPSKVLSVHNQERAVDMPEATETVTTDVVTYDDTDMRAEIVRLAAELDEMKPSFTAQARGHEYVSIGEMIVDTIAHARKKDSGATERLEFAIDTGMVEADGSAIHLMSFPNVGNSIGDSTPNDVYIPELLMLLREGRPTADLFNARPLSPKGNNIQLPDVSVGSTIGYQDGEGTAVSNTTQQWILNDFKKATMAGGQGITLQASQWSDPSYTEEVVRDLISGYGEFLDSQTINGDPAIDTPVSGTGYDGILNAGATDVPETGDVKAALALVGTGWAAVYAGSRRSPIAAIMHSSVWGSFLDQLDTDGRPIVSTEAPMNPAGFGNAASIAGTLRSIPVVLDDNAPATVVILGSFRDALLFEDPSTPAQIALTYPDVLTTDVTVYGFSSLAIRRPGAFAVLSGITL